MYNMSVLRSQEVLWWNRVARRELKMEAVMKIKFYQKLNALIESKKDNNSFLSVEKYELLIQQINTLKHDTRFFFIRTKFIRTQALGHPLGHPEIKNMIRTQGFPRQ